MFQLKKYVDSLMKNVTNVLLVIRIWKIVWFKRKSVAGFVGIKKTQKMIQAYKICSKSDKESVRETLFSKKDSHMVLSLDRSEVLQ